MCRITAILTVLLMSAATSRQQSHEPGLNFFTRPVRYSIDPATLPEPCDPAETPDCSFGDPSIGPGLIPQPHDAVLTVPKGFRVNVFGETGPLGAREVRKIVLAPNGDVFQTDQSAGQIFVLRDRRQIGVADQTFRFATGLSRPFGMVFHGDYLYVAETHALVRYSYKPGQTAATGRPEFIVGLPGGGHAARDLMISPDKRKFYIGVGSSGNVVIESDERRAAISTCFLDGSNFTVFASGLRNPMGLMFNPTTKQLWTTVNERDEIGEDLVPDFVTEVKEGGFYGWPYSYLGQHIDKRVAQNRPDLVARAIMPDVLLQSHSAPLGMVFYTGKQFPAEYLGDAFVTAHGSWNRANPTGFKVMRIRFENGRPIANEYEDFLTGWLPDPTKNEVWGRPIDVAMYTDGSLLVSDDDKNKIFRVSYCGDSCPYT